MSRRMGWGCAWIALSGALILIQWLALFLELSLAFSDAPEADVDREARVFELVREAAGFPLALCVGGSTPFWLIFGIAMPAGVVTAALLLAFLRTCVGWSRARAAE